MLSRKDCENIGLYKKEIKKNLDLVQYCNDLSSLEKFKELINVNVKCLCDLIACDIMGESRQVSYLDLDMRYEDD